MTSHLSLSEKSQKVREMFNKIAPKYDFLNRLLSFRQDVRWRNALLAHIPRDAHGVGCDVACGTGDVTFLIQKKRPHVKMLGVDISEGMLEGARLRAKRTGNEAISFYHASAEDLPLDSNSAEYLTIAFGLRNVDVRTKALSEFFRVLKPGGALLILEFFPADKGWLSLCFDFYFKRVLPKIGGLFADKQAYAYLPQSVSTMPSSPIFYELLQQAGFEKISEQKWLAGSTRLFVAYKSCSQL